MESSVLPTLEAYVFGKPACARKLLTASLACVFHTSYYTVQHRIGDICYDKIRGGNRV